MNKAVGMHPEQAAECLFGADVGGTKIQSVLTDFDGMILAKTRDATPEGGGEAVMALISQHMSALGGGRRIAAAGIGLPGAIDPVSGMIDRAPNLPGFLGKDLPAFMAKRLNMPVAVQNDVNLAALGEGWLGHGKDAPMMAEAGLAFVALGTGIGMGLVYGDRIILGRNGAAGEIAWLPIGGDPNSVAARAVGTLESVVAGGVLTQDYRRRGGLRAGNLRDLSRGEVTDPILAETMDHLAHHVALAVLGVDAIINPALFVFGGGIGSSPELLAAVRAKLQALGVPVPDMRVSLLGNRAGAIGAVRAARLALPKARLTA